MSDPLVYDSRSVRFKSPYGAVPSGTQVTFTLRPLRSEGYSRGKLTARLEGEEKPLLLRLLNAENEISNTMALENFILGFRLGMRIAIEALDEDDGNLTMTQEEGGTHHGK